MPALGWLCALPAVELPSQSCPGKAAQHGKQELTPLGCSCAQTGLIKCQEGLSGPPLLSFSLCIIADSTEVTPIYSSSGTEESALAF